MKQEDQEEAIVYKVQLLEELAQKQERLLEIANEIIDDKNRLIELCELETDLYKRQNKRLITSLIISGILFAILGVLNLIRLFI